MSKLKNACFKIKDKWSDMSPVAKASMALMFAKFFQKGLGMISGPIFTRIMSQSEYGVISTFMSWQSVLYIVATLNMDSGCFNNGMLDFKKERNSFSFSIMCLANLCTLVCAGTYILFYNQLSKLLEMPDILMVIMFLYLLFMPGYNYWMGKQRFEYKYKSTTIIMLVSSILSTVLAIVGVLLVDDNQKAVAKIIIAESVSISIGIFFFAYTIVKAKGKFKISFWKYALSFNLPLIPHYLSMYVLSSSDRIMISKLVDTGVTAIYNVAYTVATIMLIFWNSVDASYAPWIYQKMHDNDTKSIKKRGNQILVAFATLSLLCTLFAPEIIAVLAPPSYSSGVYVVPSVAAGVFFTACYSLYMRIELYLKKTKVVMVATCATAVLNLVLNYIFISMFGFIAAGYTTLVCYALLALFHYINLKRLGYGNIYDNKFIFMMSLIVLIVSVVVTVVYSFTAIRYILILVIISLMIYKRDMIVGLLKRGK